MPQEDGVSVQQRLVSAALRRLQGEHRTAEGYNMSTAAPPEHTAVPEVALQPLPICFRPLVSSVDLRASALAGMTPGLRVEGAGGHTSPGGVGFASPILSIRSCNQPLPQKTFFFCTVSASE